MCPGAVVVLPVRAQHMPQMLLAKHDHMIEALASDRADQSFSVTVLPRRSRRCRSVANAVAVVNSVLSLLYWGGLLSSAFRFLHRSSADVDRRGRASLRGRHWALP